MMERVRAITRRNRGMSLGRMLSELRAFTNGWAAYFWRAHTPSVFQSLDWWIRRRLRCFQWKQWKRSRTRAKQLVKAGAGPWLAYGVAYQRKWTLAYRRHSGHDQRPHQCNAQIAGPCQPA